MQIIDILISSFLEIFKDSFIFGERESLLNKKGLFMDLNALKEFIERRKQKEIIDLFGTMKPDSV